MDKPDINPSNYMQAKYSAALASYLEKANLSAHLSTSLRRWISSMRTYR